MAAETPYLEATIFDAAVKPAHLFGVEREVAILSSALIAVLFLAYGLNWVTPLLGTLMIAVFLPWMRRRNRKDPMVFQVFLRHTRTAGFFVAAPAPERARRRVPTL